MKDLKVTLLLITVIIILLWFGKKENFTQDANIDTFLNTWQLTNKEISNTMELSDDKITFKKPLSEVTSLGDIKGENIKGKQLHLSEGINLFGNWKDNNSLQSNEKVSSISNDTKDYKTMMIVGNRSSSGRRKIGLWDDVTINGDLCIGNTCINENHLKVLTGGKAFSIKSDLNQTRLENYNKNAGFWWPKDENAQKMRIHQIRD